MSETREVIRCPACGLNQFMMRSGDCRRCSVSMTPAESQVEIAATLRTSRHSCKLTDVFALNIVMARHARKWSQVDLAVRLGTSPPWISRLENRASRPDLRTIERFAQAFGIPAFVLLIPPPKTKGVTNGKAE